MGRTLDNCKLQHQADTCSSYGFVGIATGALTKGHTLDMVGEHGVGSPGQHKVAETGKESFGGLSLLKESTRQVERVCLS